jgi:hypothetical protein
MSSVKYQKAYDRMTEKQKQIMANLYMKGINRDGHSWNTYGDIEEAVADLLELTEETTSCEWCEAELSFEVVWHSFGSSFVDKAMFCPNCGRRLED